MYIQLGVAFVCLYILIRWVLRSLYLSNNDKRYVFITGCDTGFGNLLAKRLDRNGVNVIAGCLTSNGAAELRNACSQTLKTVELDVGKETSIIQAKENVLKLLPAGKGLWALVNNAGISGSVAPIEWQTQADFRSVIEINLFGVIFVTNAFLPLVRRERGRVVNMTSITGRFPNLIGPYCAAKCAVEGFSDVYAQQMWSLILSQAFSPELHKVVDSYEHAILSRFPKHRYVVGWDANIPIRILWNLPEWLSDFIITRRTATPAGAKNITL